MPKKLKDLTIDEVSLVDVPANKGARVVLFKSDKDVEDQPGWVDRLMKYLKRLDEGGPSTHEEQMPDEKKLEELTVKIARLEIERDVAKASTKEDVASVRKAIGEAPEAVREDLTKALDAREAEIANSADEERHAAFRAKLPAAVAKAFDELDAEGKDKFAASFKDEGDPVAKALESVTKDNEKLTKTVARLERAQKLDAVRKELGDLPDADAMAEEILELREAGKDDLAKRTIERAKAAAKAVEDSDVFKVLGVNDMPEGSAVERLDKMAKERAKVDKSTYEVAYSAVLQENPDLYAQAEAEKEAK